LRVNPSQVRALTEDLVRIESIVATPGEAAIGRWIFQRLGSLPYFRREPGHLELIRTRDDEHERYLVLALVKGRGVQEGVNPQDTVVLFGHTDTVGTGDYGALKPWALEPGELAARLAVLPGLPSEVCEDLESGEWLFGRGSLDMKAGVAVHMALVEYLSSRAEQMTGNVLFLATPDEEDMSHGILTALDRMAQVAREQGLRYVAAINADYTSPLYPGDPNRYVYLGSVGKVLPSFFITGKETHVGQPFEGFDPNLVAAELTRLIDLNPELADEGLGEVAAPPVSLKVADLKDVYTVQTPVAAYAYYNFFTHSKSPEEVLHLMLEVGRRAFQNALDLMESRRLAYCQRTGIPAGPCPWKVRVVSWEEFRRDLDQRHGTAFEDALRALAESMLEDPSIDLRVFSRRMVEEAWTWSEDKSPCAVLYFSSAFSPRVVLTGARPEETKLMDAVSRAVNSLHDQIAWPVAVRNFFPYISDMSLLAMSEDEGSIDCLARNMPAWGEKYTFDPRPVMDLNVPVINVGTYGKDAHKMTERVHMPYTFQVLPELTLRIVEQLVGFEEAP